MANEAQVRKYLDPEEPDYKAAAAALGAEALPVLDALVRGADPLLASKAAYLAALIPDPQAAGVLETAARSEHPTVRVAAAAGLQKRPEAAPEVAVHLTNDPDAGVRKVAARAAARRSGAASRPGAAPGVKLPQITEGAHGGGYSPETEGDAERAAGEGGGDTGSGTARQSSVSAGDADGEGSGGGGDLGGGAVGRSSASSDAADGGGSSATDTGQGVLTHGGGSV